MAGSAENTADAKRRAAAGRCAVARGRFWKWSRLVEFALELVPEWVTPELVALRDKAECDFVIADLERAAADAAAVMARTGATAGEADSAEEPSA